MSRKADVETWVLEALKAQGGQATVLEVAKHVWANREADLRASGSLFYTWQYEIRWAAQRLRHAGRLMPITTRNGIWAVRD